MNRFCLLFLGIFLSFALSWAGMVLLPQLQIGQQAVVPLGPAAQLYPSGRSGLAEQGRQVYRSLGCAACHTQQVRPVDVPRWGQRMTVAQDYLRDDPVLFGAQRIGPDLSNIGLRMPDANWHMLHLYNPKIHVPESSMPPYRFLFREQRIQGGKSASALSFPQSFATPAGFEVVPTARARALVAYLQSLRIDTFLFEAPNPIQIKPAATTNEPPAAAGVQQTNVSSTNSPEAKP